MSSSRSPPSLKLITSSAPAQPVSTSPQADCHIASSSSAGDRSRHAAQHAHHDRAAQSQSPFRYVIGLQSCPPSPKHQSKTGSWNEKAGDSSFNEVVLTPIRISPRSATSGSGSISRSSSRGGERRHSELNYGLDEKRAMESVSPVAGPSRTGCPSSQRRPDAVAHARPSNLASMACSSQLNSSNSLGLSSMPPPPPSPPSKWLRRERLRPWIPYILYGMTSLGFLLAITFWKDDVFRNLDDLAHWLREEGDSGYLYLGAMIFVTCIPPLPLYSTLQVLSGYTFGAWTGGVVSYVSALLGALFVFAVSRLYFRRAITRALSHTVSFRRVVRAIAKRPSLLFLVRLAPYPYNMLNALLAGAPTLTFRTYAGCTALSLFKVWIHTTIGASIHSFAAYHLHKSTKEDGDDLSGSPELGDEDGDPDFLSQATTIGGLVLCIAIAVYLSIVARRAVNEELDDDGDDDLEEMEEGNSARSHPPSIIERLHARERERERARDRRLGNDEERAALFSGDSGNDSSNSLDGEEQEMADRNTGRF